MLAARVVVRALAVLLEMVEPVASAESRATAVRSVALVRRRALPGRPERAALGVWVELPPERAQLLVLVVRAAAAASVAGEAPLPGRKASVEPGAVGASVVRVAPAAPRMPRAELLVEAALVAQVAKAARPEVRRAVAGRAAQVAMPVVVVPAVVLPAVTTVVPVDRAAPVAARDVVATEGRLASAVAVALVVPAVPAVPPTPERAARVVLVGALARAVPVVIELQALRTAEL